MPSAILENIPLAKAPPKVTASTTRRATRPTNKLPQALIDGARVVERVPFEPRKHVNFEHPRQRITMRDIGLEGHGISPIAASEPFPLFSEEAIAQMRAEAFSEEALAHCQYQSGFCKNMIRGLGPAYVRLTHVQPPLTHLLTLLKAERRSSTTPGTRPRCFRGCPKWRGSISCRPSTTRSRT